VEDFDLTLLRRLPIDEAALEAAAAAEVERDVEEWECG
jgi:hypothetical protein